VPDRAPESNRSPSQAGAIKGRKKEKKRKKANTSNSLKCNYFILLYFIYFILRFWQASALPVACFICILQCFFMDSADSVWSPKKYDTKHIACYSMVYSLIPPQKGHEKGRELKHRWFASFHALHFIRGASL